MQVLGEFDGDVDAAVEYMIAELVAVCSDNVDEDLYMDYACKGKL
jgi:OTU domain-containing protein 3